VRRGRAASPQLTRSRQGHLQQRRNVHVWLPSTERTIERTRGGSARAGAYGHADRPSGR
jgi:hypothetical protein